MWVKSKKIQFIISICFFQASGFPPDVVTEEEKDAFVDEYFRSTGVHLDKSKVQKNEQLRFLAKQTLNSLWLVYVFSYGVEFHCKYSNFGILWL